VKPTKKRTSKDYGRLFLNGFLMGSADIVPGVSGGTMAFILGIYEELVHSISQINKKLIQNLLNLKIKEIFKTFPWPFLLALGSGIITAIALLSHTLEWLLENQPIYVWSFFLGLVIASIPTITNGIKVWTISKIILFIIGTLVAYILIGLTPATTPNSPFFIFFSGMLASMAMILPGISGSFILVLLGKYKEVLHAVNARDIVTLSLVGTGATVGLVSFSKILDYVFKKYHDYAIAVLAGFVLGAIRKIWPYKNMVPVMVDNQTVFNEINVLPPINMTLLISLALIGCGALLISIINKAASKKLP